MMEEDNSKKPEAGVDVSAKQLNMTRSVSLKLRRALGVVGMPFAIGAWVAFFFSPLIAVVLACIGLGLSAVGVTVGRGCLRDLSITFVITSLVIIIVYALFDWGIPYAVNSL